MILKKKRKRVWCKEKPLLLENHNILYSHGSEKIGNKIVERNGAKTKLPPRVTCPDCKKRFKPRLRECHDPGCWHISIPAHKAMI